jgi:hypothetical protein
MDPGLRRDDGVDVDGHFNVTPAQAGVQAPDISHLLITG